MSWTREQVTVLLEEYRKWPNLYKVKSVNYKNRNKRREALDSIVDAVKTVKSDVTSADIQSKFQALKQNAQRERKKCIESQRSGAGTDEIVEPSLWYFNLIQFVFDDMDPRPAVDSLQDITHQEPDDVQDMVDDDSQEGPLMLDLSQDSNPAMQSPVLMSPTTLSSDGAGPSWLYAKPSSTKVSGTPKPKKRSYLLIQQMMEY
ncbi:unnamed protein product [Callosobruchus maculatus]|uniref:MADF domain-containing protein n=1 Tax=Callosobruchus maculatus TaxID=64391 RepID=A0A653CR94_CALMS|nr:unnamed protein product [Callosobruchus maculatus]